MTDIYAVVGNPVEHSQSPFIHQSFAAQTSQDLDYERWLVPIDGLKPWIDAQLHASTPNKSFKGCNITIPFKFDAFALATELTPRAKLAGAINTLHFTHGECLGDNTDGVGLVRDLQHNAGLPLKGQSILILGAGGASAGVLGPLLETQPSELVIANRTQEKAQTILNQHQHLSDRLSVKVQSSTLEALNRPFDVVINATAASLQQAQLPISPIIFGPNCLAYDMMYGPKIGRAHV